MSRSVPIDEIKGLCLGFSCLVCLEELHHNMHQKSGVAVVEPQTTDLAITGFNPIIFCDLLIPQIGASTDLKPRMHLSL